MMKDLTVHLETVLDLINDRKDLRVCQKSYAVSSGMDQSWYL